MVNTDTVIDLADIRDDILSEPDVSKKVAQYLDDYYNSLSAIVDIMSDIETSPELKEK